MDVIHKDKKVLVDGESVHYCALCGESMSHAELVMIENLYMDNVRIGTCASEACQRTASLGIRRIVTQREQEEVESLMAMMLARAAG